MCLFGLVRVSCALLIVLYRVLCYYCECSGVCGCCEFVVLYVIIVSVCLYCPCLLV